MVGVAPSDDECHTPGASLSGQLWFAVADAALETIEGHAKGRDVRIEEPLGGLLLFALGEFDHSAVFVHGYEVNDLIGVVYVARIAAIEFAGDGGDYFSFSVCTPEQHDGGDSVHFGL